MQYDVAVVGSGPGGYVAALKAVELGLKTVCIEESPFFGGTCLHVGCIPSKTLLHASEYFHNVDWQVLQEKKNQVIQGLAGAIQSHFQAGKVDSIHGKARLVDSHTLEVGNERLTASSIILATGSEPISLPFLQVDEKDILSSTGALSLEKVPKSLLVVGGGVIGVELASVFSRLGTEVTVIELLPSLCTGIDQSLAAALLQVLKKQNIRFLLNTKVINAEGTKLQLGSGEWLEAEKVLISIGRRPRSKDLGIDLKLTTGGFVEVNEKLQTSVPNIYAIGDLIEGPMLAHRASLEAVAAVKIIAKKPYTLDYMAVPNVIYTSPEVATVGLTEVEARSFKKEILVGQSYFRGNPRARCCDTLDGFVKVVADGQSKRILGLHMLGMHASEMIAIGSLAVSLKATLSDLADLPFAHPTYSESIKEACQFPA